jgi:hypothetical protein
MKKKLSSYQKLKKEVASLRADLRELVLNPNSFESQMIKSDIVFFKQMEDALFIGNGSSDDGKAKGLMNWVTDHSTVVINSTADELVQPPHDSTIFKPLKLEPRGRDSVDAYNIKLPQKDFKPLSSLSDDNKPVLGELYIDGTVVLECMELGECSECYLNAVLQNTGLPHAQCEKSGCGTRIFEKGRYSYILGFIRKCSAWKEDI